jgi:hypothetical protein
MAPSPNPFSSIMSLSVPYLSLSNDGFPRDLYNFTPPHVFDVFDGFDFFDMFDLSV